MNYSIVEKCRGCHATRVRMDTVLSMDPMPLAGMFCESAEEAAKAPIFPLTWMHCTNCGVVQVAEDISDSYLFSRYNYASSTVPGLVRHFDSYAEFLAGRYSPEEKIRFLEIGCNDGVLLRRLPRKWKLQGFDPSDVAKRAALQNEVYELHPRPFNLATTRQSSLEGTIDVVSGSNCLAHISDLKDVFEAAWIVLREQGHFWIEVHDLDALFNGNQWDTIYHEHKVEWSEQSLIRCLTAVGFVHRETHRTPMHGGALRILFEKTPERRVPGEGRIPLDPALSTLREAYQRRYEVPAVLKLKQKIESGQKIAAYGAAGRANVYLNQMLKLRFEYIVDESPLRMNKFLPRVGTPVVPPSCLHERPVSACLVTAWNYRDDIIQKAPQHQGDWLTAFGAE
jgi:SAM-dependent methyltransferase